jgi:hypothetical protein
MLAWGVVGAVSSFSQLHRAGRIDRDLDDLARFTGRFVVRSLAASDAIADEVAAGTLPDLVPL